MVNTFYEIQKEFEFINGSANLTSIQLNKFENQVANINVAKYEGRNIEISFTVTNVTATDIIGFIQFGGVNPTAYYDIKCLVKNNLEPNLIKILRGDKLTVIGCIVNIKVIINKHYYYLGTGFGHSSEEIFHPRIELNLESVKLLSPKNQNIGCLGFIMQFFGTIY